MEGGRAWISEYTKSCKPVWGGFPNSFASLTQFFRHKQGFSTLFPMPYTYKCTSGNAPEPSEGCWCNELEPRFPKTRPLPQKIQPAVRHSWMPEKCAAGLSSNMNNKKFKWLFCSGGTLYLSPEIVVELIHAPPFPISKFHHKGCWKQRKSYWNLKLYCEMMTLLRSKRALL